VLCDLPCLVQESQDAGVQVMLADDLPEPGAVPAAVSRTAYRIVQEGLTNARKHAEGQPVALSVAGRPGEGLVVEISNPIIGRPSRTPGTGTGLIGLAERVQLAGGRLDHDRTAAGRFRLHAWLPWPP